MMAQWLQTSWGRGLARCLVILMVVESLWGVAQRFPWEVMYLHEVLADMLTLILPRAASAAEVDRQVRLAPGFNLFAYPIEVPAGMTCADLQTRLGAQTLQRFNPQTQQVETCAPPQVLFPIVPGEGYIVEMAAANTVTLHGASSCAGLGLAAGMNLVGIPSPPPGLSCFALLHAFQERGTSATIQRFHLVTGAFESCTPGPEGKPDGVDFGLTSGEAYLVFTRTPLTAFNPNDQTACPSSCVPPTITAVTPHSGPVGTVVSITGTHLDCGTPNLAFNGVPAVLTSRTPTLLTTAIPLGGQDGLFTLTTGGGVVTAPPGAAFDVVLSKDFSLAAVPSQATVLQGSATTYRLSASGTQGFSGLMTFEITGLPAGISSSLSSPTLTAGQSADLILVAAPTAALTPTLFTVTGRAQIDGVSVSRSVSMTLNVLAGGQTALVGQFTLRDGTPLAGVKLGLAGQSTTTDAGGNFQFVGIPAGTQPLSVDVTPVDPQLPMYGMDVTLTAGQVLRLPAFRIAPPMSPEQYTPIQNATQDQAITDPRYPGAAFILPAGVTIMGWDGQPKTRMTLQRLSPDELPVPPPPGPTRSVYQPMFGTPMGGLPSAPIPVTLPNDLDLLPGDKAELWYYDAAPFPGVPGAWRMAGMGTVSQDGATIVSDPGVGITRFCGVCGLSCFIPRQGGQPNMNGESPKGGDPIDLFLGQMIVEKTDLTLPGRIPAVIRRTYNPFEPFGAVAGFELGLGPGWALSMDVVLQEENASLRRIILPGNSRFAFTKQPDGTFVNTTHRQFVGAVLTAEGGGGHLLRLKEGTVWRFASGWLPPGRPIPIAGLGLLVEQIDRHKNRLVIERDRTGAVVRLIEPAGRTLTFTQTAGRITEIRDPIGRTVRYSYNSARRLETVTDPAGGVTRYTYDPAGRILTVTDPRGITYLTNTYDASGRVVRQTQADGSVWKFEYRKPCAPGALPLGSVLPVCFVSTAAESPTSVVMIDPRGNTTTHRLSQTGFASETVDALGQVTRQERDAQGQVIAITDPLKRVRRFEYDGAGNVIRVIDPAGNSRSFVYEPIFNNVVSLTNLVGNVLTFAYDARGNLIRTTDPLGNATQIAYDMLGQMISITNPLGHTATFTYDAEGNLVALSDALGNTTEQTYDTISRLITQTDARGQTTGFAYDALNRVIEMVDALHGRTLLSYDGNNNLLTLTDVRGNTMAQTYDVMDRLQTRTDPLGVTESFVYDAAWNLLQHTDRKGQTRTFRYDALNRRVEARYADGTSIAFVYDPVGRLMESVDSVGGRLVNEYDVLDRLLAQTSPAGKIAYTYDALGRKTRMAVPGQEPTTYAYDAASRPTQIVQGTQIVTLQYDILGRRTRLTFPNGVTTEYQYDPASRLTSLVYRSATDAVLGDLTYTYDPAGNRLRMGGSFARLLLPEPLAAATYDAANRQSTFGGRSLTYDANGNLTHDGSLSYTWDTRNRLVGLTGPRLDASFTYDALERRSTRVVNGIDTTFLYDAFTPVQEHSQSVVSANVLAGPQIDEYFVRSDSTKTCSLFADALGSILALVDPAGTVQTSYTYEPFGRTMATGAATTNTSEYTGRENDATGLLYYRARYYNPQLQRFISEDPLGLGGGMNLYGYVRENPVNFVDPTGLATGYSGGPGGGIYKDVDGVCSQAVLQGYYIDRWVPCPTIPRPPPQPVPTKSRDKPSETPQTPPAGGPAGPAPGQGSGQGPGRGNPCDSLACLQDSLIDFVRVELNGAFFVGLTHVIAQGGVAAGVISGATAGIIGASATAAGIGLIFFGVGLLAYHARECAMRCQ